MFSSDLSSLLGDTFGQVVSRGNTEVTMQHLHSGLSVCVCLLLHQSEHTILLELDHLSKGTYYMTLVFCI